MQWDNSRAAGFTTGEAWLPLNSDHRKRNVESQWTEDISILNLYSQLIELRRRCPALSVGSYTAVAATGDLLLYRREERDEHLLIALNLDAEPTIAELKQKWFGRVPISTGGDRAGEAMDGTVALRGNEGVIVEIVR
jgi:alpha-glucosidase